MLLRQNACHFKNLLIQEKLFIEIFKRSNECLYYSRYKNVNHVSNRKVFLGHPVQFPKVFQCVSLFSKLHHFQHCREDLFQISSTFTLYQVHLHLYEENRERCNYLSHDIFSNLQRLKYSSLSIFQCNLFAATRFEWEGSGLSYYCLIFAATAY